MQGKETFNSIGRLYRLTGEEVADYNNLEYYNAAVLPKYLTIPLNKKNYSKGKKAGSNEILVPVFRVNGSSERIVQFKKNSKRTASGFSLIYNNNRLVSKFDSKLVIDGFLHTSKTSQTVFTTIPIDDVKTTIPTGIVNPKQELVPLAKVDPNINTSNEAPPRKIILQQAVIDSVPIAHTAVTPTPKIVSSSIKTERKKVAPTYPDNTAYRPVSRVDKVYLLVKIQIVICAFLVVAIFTYMAIKNRREVFKKRLDGSLRTLLIREILTEDSFTDNINSSLTFSEILKKQLQKKSNRQFVINEIINGRKNIKGRFGDNFLRLYLKLRLDQDSSTKLKSKNWNNVAKGIQELAIMEQHHKMPEIFNEINSSNEHVRMEAQTALVHLSGFGGLWFLNVLNYPISEWQQMRLISMLSSSPVSDIPDLHLLLSSPNESLVIFTLRLIGQFQQRSMHNEVVKCLRYKSEKVRFVALRCLKEIYNQHTANIFIRRFANETRRNKITIVKIIGEIGNEEHTDFLLEVLALYDDTLKITAARALSNMGNNAGYLLEEYCITHGDPYSKIFLHVKSAV
ncbi:MAG: repeat protein [Segetibacter sp.]|nr:repeat protein [Segetibacter sp.]